MSIANGSLESALTAITLGKKENSRLYFLCHHLLLLLSADVNFNS